MGFEYSYFLNKYLPWSTIQYTFPEHPLIAKLQEIAGNDRVYGYDLATISTNLSVQWRLQSPEGYDPLYSKTYSELLTAGKTGKLETDLPRSDALLPPSLPMNDAYSKQVLMNILGVRYVVDKNDLAPKKWDPRPDRFPQNRFELRYQWYKWKIYENKMALPRALVFYNYTAITQKDKALATLFDHKFPYRQKLIVTNAPTFLPQQSSATPAKISHYSANDVEILTDTKKQGLLFLSDNFYPGWQATVDGKSMPILLADYSFRAVQIPAGKHTVLFFYRPMSFYLGAAISLLTLILLGILSKKKFA